MRNVELTTGDLEAILRQHHIPRVSGTSGRRILYAGQRPEQRFLLTCGKAIAGPH